MVTPMRRLTTADLGLIAGAMGTLLVSVQHMIRVSIPRMDQWQAVDQRERQAEALQLARQVLAALEGVRPMAPPAVGYVAPYALHWLHERPLDTRQWLLALKHLQAHQRTFPPHALTMEEFQRIVRKAGNHTWVRHYFAYNSGGDGDGRGLCVELLIERGPRGYGQELAGWRRVMTNDTPTPPREVEQDGSRGIFTAMRFFWNRAEVRS